jgi:cell pole-organizing protein PopZ
MSDPEIPSERPAEALLREIKRELAYLSDRDQMFPAAAPQAEERQLSRERVLEEVLRELLRPMIQTWLDQNLQSLAERVILAEIREGRLRSADSEATSFAERVAWLVRRR